MKRLTPASIPWYSSKLFIASLLIVATAAVYQPVLHCEFVNLDDGEYVEHNEHVLSGLSAGNLWWALTTTTAGNWHPLTWISLQLDASLWGHNPSGYHFTNLLFHTANTVLLFLVLQHMTGATWLSAAVAALFGLHPLHVETVAWVTERKDVVSTFFWILTMAVYAGYVARPRLGRYLLMMATFAVGLAAKPMLVTLPFALLLLDYWPLDRLSRRRLLEKVPLLILSIASAVTTVYAQERGGAIQSTQDYPLLARFGNTAAAYLTYLGRFIWPANLSVLYPYDRNVNVVWPLVAWSALLAITLFVIWRRNERHLFVGWFWYLGTLVPVIGLVQVGVQAMADRYTYIPSIGLFIAVVWAFAEWARILAFPRWFSAGLTIAILAACGVAANAQASHWMTSGTLWEQALRADPNNSVAHKSLGSFHLRRGDDNEAMQQFRLALECNPNDAEAHFDLGAVLAKNKRVKEAINEYEQAVRIKPDVAEWHSNLGGLLLHEGKKSQAVEHLRRAVELRPDLERTRRVLEELEKEEKDRKTP
jgi:tetratricopeptide (TPR) repeat protein